MYLVKKCLFTRHTLTNDLVFSKFGNFVGKRREINQVMLKCQMPTILIRL